MTPILQCRLSVIQVSTVLEAAQEPLLKKLLNVTLVVYLFTGVQHLIARSMTFCALRQAVL